MRVYLFCDFFKINKAKWQLFDYSKKKSELPRNELLSKRKFGEMKLSRA